MNITATSLLLLALSTSAFAEDKPAAEKPATPPATEKPATEKPATEKPAAEKPAGGVEAVVIGDNAVRFTIDTTQAPDLAPWTKEKLIPVIKEWYPKIVEMLPGKDYQAPTQFSITFDNNYKGVAATMGTRVVCNPEWYRKELNREGLGSVVHELVHVVQQYGGRRTPGWLTEGAADYIRWYLYEPQSKGCEIPAGRADRVKHDMSYRVSANFLNWIIATHDKDFLRELNAALREGRYSAELWTQRTKKDLATLGEDWKKFLKEQK
jgi:Peptidase of plants and bacteria